MGIPGPGQRGWAKSTLRAGQVASRMDAALKGLTNMKLDSKVGLDLGGRPAEGEGTASIGSQRRWRIESVEVRLSPIKVGYGIQVADGTRFSILGEKTWSPARPLAQRRWEGDLVQRWPLEFITLFLYGLGTARNPFTEYVTAMSKRGAQVVVEQRTVTFNGRKLPQYRVLVRRTGYDFEAVVDGTRWVPVTFRMKQARPKGKPVQINWTARYTPNQVFPATMFKVP
jgi:hypothetical protein